MSKKNRGLLVSVIAGLIAIVLVLAALVLHIVDSDTAMAGSGSDLSTAHHGETTAEPTATTPTTAAPTTRETMIMPDGSVMYMDDMPAAAEQGSTGAAADTATEGHDSMAGMDMGGSIDWQVILLILALVAACVAVATAVNSYLQRQAETGAFARLEADCE
jgi:hypothetical protein